MAKGIHFTFNSATFSQMRADGGMIDQGVARAAGQVRDGARRIIQQKGLIDTGRMSQSLYSKRLSSQGSMQIIYLVGSDLEYALYQHEGTKDHGPRRARILAFPGRGGKTVFTMRVRGVKASKFLTTALDHLTPSDFT